MPFSQHRMALASLFVAVIAVLFISGSTVRAGTAPVLSAATAQPMVAVPHISAETIPTIAPNYTAIGPLVPDSTPVPEVTSPAAEPVVIAPAATDPEPAVRAASLGGPTVLGPQLSISTVALSHVGTYGGECWVFMQHVVLEATGRKVGTDYVKGFKDVGGYEIPISEAGPNDIIQILDNRYTGPDADYAGMHTSIVIQNHEDGAFTVVESNAEWNGMVTLNKDYHPDKIIKQLPWLSIHAFRVPQIPSNSTTLVP